MLYTRKHNSDSSYTSLYLCISYHRGVLQKTSCAYHAQVYLGSSGGHVPRQTDAGRNSAEHRVYAPCTKTAETQHGIRIS